jgi:hypothetical protein
MLLVLPRLGSARLPAQLGILSYKYDSSGSLSGSERLSRFFLAKKGNFPCDNPSAQRSAHIASSSPALLEASNTYLT